MEIYFGTVTLTLLSIVKNDSEIGKFTVFKWLGPVIANKLSWNKHVEYMPW